jgi:hypothetical protein
MIITRDTEIFVAEPTEIDLICMEMRGLSELYVFRFDNEENDYSVKFTSKELAEFRPKDTVEGFILGTYDNFKRLISLYEKSIENNTHPEWTYEKKIVQIINGVEFVTNKTETTPTQLTKSQREYYQKEIDIKKRRLGKLKFYVIPLTNFVTK